MSLDMVQNNIYSSLNLSQKEIEDIHESIQNYKTALTEKAIQRMKADRKNFVITLEDLKPGMEQTFYSFLQSRRVDAVFQEYVDIIVTIEHAPDKASFIEKNHIFIADIKSQINDKVAQAIKQFQSGASFSVIKKISASDFNFNRSLLADFHLNKTHFGKEKKHDPFEKKRNAMQLNLMVARHLKSEVKEQEKKDRVNDLIDNLLLYYCFLASKFGLDLDKIPQECFLSLENKKSYEEFKEKKRVAAELQRQLEIEKSFGLQLTSPSKPAKTKGKQKKKQHSAKCELVKQEKPQTCQKSEDLQVPVLPASIFPQKADFFLDRRITRWFRTPLEGIKKFPDTGASGIVHHYQKMSVQQLEDQRVYHTLPGVERLMSLSPENLQKYSTPYEFQHNGSTKCGRCFLAELLREGGVMEEGVIYIGADGKRIYHAKFVPLMKGRSSASETVHPTDFCLKLDGLDSTPEMAEEGEWEMVGGYELKTINDEIIWSIGSGKTKAQYKLSSLS